MIYIPHLQLPSCKRPGMGPCMSSLPPRHAFGMRTLTKQQLAVGSLALLLGDRDNVHVATHHRFPAFSRFLIIFVDEVRKIWVRRWLCKHAKFSLSFSRFCLSVHGSWPCQASMRAVFAEVGRLEATARLRSSHTGECNSPLRCLTHVRHAVEAVSATCGRHSPVDS